MNTQMRVALFLAFGCCTIKAEQALPEVAGAAPRGTTVSLLHQNTAAQVTAHSGAALGQPVWNRGHPLNPRVKGHMLTDSELQPISNVGCLEAKQIDPSVNCSDVAPEFFPGPSAIEKLNAGNYPTWKDPRCHSNGEYFCDPDQLLKTEERVQLATTMKTLRQGQHVTCGPQLQHDPVDKWHYQPFYLGVAIAKDWPLHESDSQTLQSFGRILSGRWNMTYLWNGDPTFYARCPNEAMLIILPDRRQAHLSAPSCMFICEEHGGPEVATATLVGMDTKGGLLAGVEAGIAEVYKALAQSSPMHQPGWQPVEKTAGTWSDNASDKAAVVTDKSGSLEEGILVWMQRILFMIAVGMVVGSLAVALLVCYLAPGMAKDLNKSVV